jgi:hypothetical protein
MPCRRDVKQGHRSITGGDKASRIPIDEASDMSAIQPQSQNRLQKNHRIHVLCMEDEESRDQRLETIEGRARTMAPIKALGNCDSRQKDHVQPSNLTEKPSPVSNLTLSLTSIPQIRIATASTITPSTGANNPYIPSRRHTHRRTDETVETA